MILLKSNTFDEGFNMAGVGCCRHFPTSAIYLINISSDTQAKTSVNDIHVHY